MSIHFELHAFPKGGGDYHIAGPYNDLAQAKRDAKVRASNDQFSGCIEVWKLETTTPNRIGSSYPVVVHAERG